MPLLSSPIPRAAAWMRSFFLIPTLAATALLSACATPSGPSGSGSWGEDFAPAPPAAILDDVRVSELRGSATIQGDGRTIALKPGTLIAENQPVQLGPKSSLRLDLGIRAAFELGPNSRFVVHQLPRDGTAAQRETGLRLEKGYLRILASDDPAAAPIELSFARWAAKLGPGEYFFDARTDTASACSARGTLDLAGVPEWTPQAVESSCVNLAPRRDPVLVSLRDKDWQTLRAQRRLQPTLARAASRPAPRTQTATLEPDATPRAERAVARTGQTLAYLPATPVVARIVAPEYAAPAPAPAVVLFADPPEDEMSEDDLAAESVSASNGEDDPAVVVLGAAARDSKPAGIPHAAKASPEVVETPMPTGFTPSLEIVERAPATSVEVVPAAVDVVPPSQAAVVQNEPIIVAEPMAVRTPVTDQPLGVASTTEPSANPVAPPAMPSTTSDPVAVAAVDEGDSTREATSHQPPIIEAEPPAASAAATLVPVSSAPAADAVPDVMTVAPAASPIATAAASPGPATVDSPPATNIPAPVEVATYVPSDASAPGVIGSDTQGAMIAPPDALPAEWIVNVASYPMIEAAQEHAQTLTAQNYKAGVRHETVRGRSSYRVVIEGLPTELAAQSAARELQSRYGIRTAWVLRKR